MWVADLTYVAIAVRFVFVAVILDAWSRRVVGYAISLRIDTRLTSRRCRRRLKHGGHRLDVSTTPIAVANMPPSYIVRPWLTLACAVRYGLDGAILMITPSRKFHEDAQMRACLLERISQLRGGR